jgi:hypothetical protein
VLALLELVLAVLVMMWAQVLESWSASSCRGSSATVLAVLSATAPEALAPASLLGADERQNRSRIRVAMLLDHLSKT